MALDRLNQDVVGETPRGKKAALADLSWLDVSPEAYRMNDTLPKQNLNIAPDLQKIWNHSTDPVDFSLVPNKDRLTTNPDDIKKTAMDIEQESKAIARVLNYAKRQMIAGKTGTDLAEAIRTSFDKQLIQAARKPLTALLREQGLYGKVYVGSDVFDSARADSGKLAMKVLRAGLLIKKAKNAKSVFAMADFSAFREQFVDEVPYSRKLAKQHLSKLHAAGRALKIKLPEKTATADYRALIQAAYLDKSTPERAETNFVYVDHAAEAKRTQGKVSKESAVLHPMRIEANKKLNKALEVIEALKAKGIFSKKEAATFQKKTASLAETHPHLVGKPLLAKLREQAAMRMSSAHEYTGSLEGTNQEELQAQRGLSASSKTHKPYKVKTAKKKFAHPLEELMAGRVKTAKTEREEFELQSIGTIEINPETKHAFDEEDFDLEGGWNF